MEVDIFVFEQNLDESGVPLLPLHIDGQGYALCSALLASDKSRQSSKHRSDEAPVTICHKSADGSADQPPGEAGQSQCDTEGNFFELEGEIAPPAASAAEAKAISDSWKMAALEVFFSSSHGVVVSPSRNTLRLLKYMPDYAGQGRRADMLDRGADCRKQGSTTAAVSPPSNSKPLNNTCVPAGHEARRR